MEDFRIEVKTLVQNWQCSEKEWATSEKIWKEKERQWLKKELEYLKNTEDPAGDKETRPWKESEEDWEQKQCSYKSPAELWRSIEIMVEEPVMAGYRELLETQLMYEEKQKHWARRNNLWLQKEAWFRGREQILAATKLNFAKTEELKSKLLQEENTKMKASVAELHARVVAAKKKELQFEKKHDKWRDSEQGLEKKITDMEHQVKVSEEEFEKRKKDWLEREEALNEKAMILEENLRKEVKLRQLMQETYKKLENMCLKQKEEWDEEKRQWTERESGLQQKNEDLIDKCLELLEMERLLEQAQAEKNKQTEIMAEQLEAERKQKREDWVRKELQYEIYLLELLKITTKASVKLEEWVQLADDKDKRLADFRKESEEREQQWKEKEARWIEENEKLKQQINAQNLSARPETGEKVTFVEAQEDVQTPEAEKKKEKKQRWRFFARIFRCLRKPNEE